VQIREKQRNEERIYTSKNGTLLDLQPMQLATSKETEQRTTAGAKQYLPGSLHSETKFC
jgi:hypothetical protein